MIIDDEHQVAFVHIPKCGGTSIRKQISQLDSHNGKFGDAENGFSHKREHPILGLIAHAHIPLPFLKQHYPDDYAKLVAYKTFALVRDPHARFASATFQRLAEFRQLPRSEITSGLAIREARNVSRWLEGRHSFCDLEYIHFTRQVDYIRLGHEQVADQVFPIENIAEFGVALQRFSGVPFDPTLRDNVNFVLSDSTSFIKKFAKPLYSRVFSWELRKRVLDLMRRQNLQTTSGHYAAFRRDPEIRSFVETYYADDFKIYNEAKARIALAQDRSSSVAVATEALAAG